MGNADIRFYASILFRRLPYVLAIVGLLTAAGVAAAFMMPPVYRATGKILVEPPQIPADMARPTVETNPLEQLQIIEQRLMTRDNLLDLARRLDIYGGDIASMSEADIVENLRDRTLLELVPAGRSSDGRGATLFSVSFTAENPALAAKVVNEFAAFILERNIGLRTSKAEDTMQFFDKEVARLGTELASREEDVLQFKNANKDALPDSLDFRRSQQRNQEEKLLLLEREEASLRVRRNNLVKMFEVTGQTGVSGPVSPEQELLRDLKRALSEQLSVFSETSPNVVALRTRIAALQKELQSDDTTSVSVGGTSELDLQLADIDERLSFIDREKAAIAKNLSELASTIDATPQNETRLNALERSRDNIRMQYNTAVAKLAEASTGEQIEMRSKGGRFSLVEPATPPENRISPDRRKIAGLGLAGGLAAGFGLVILLEFLNGSIRRPAELARVLQAQPLATIPYIRLPAERSGGKAGRAGMFAVPRIAATLPKQVGEMRRRWNIS